MVEPRSTAAVAVGTLISSGENWGEKRGCGLRSATGQNLVVLLEEERPLCGPEESWKPTVVRSTD